jgi:hypothetical protein
VTGFGRIADTERPEVIRLGSILILKARLTISPPAYAC